VENSKITWTDNTFNPWIGCTQVSPACDNCYAMVMMDQRYSRVKWGPGNPRQRTTPANWRKPLAWNWRAAALGIRPRIFCASLADVFDSEVPDKWRGDLWNLIDETPNLDWLLLTKRPASIAGMVPWGGSWPENVWIGTSVENQQFADSRLPILCRLPAKVKWISAEPLLGPMDLTGYDLDWVVTGGESGAGWRPLDPEHVRSLRDQCQSRGIAFHFKQWSGFKPHNLGRVMDGIIWDEYPLDSGNERGRQIREAAIQFKKGIFDAKFRWSDPCPELVGAA